MLGSGEPDVSDPFGGLEPADRPTPRRDAPPSEPQPASGQRRASTKTDQPASSERAPSAAERKRSRREQDRAEQARKAAARELAGADAELEKATVAVAIAREKLADAERQQAEANERRLAAAEKVAQAEDAIASHHRELVKFRRPDAAETARERRQPDIRDAVGILYT